MALPRNGFSLHHPHDDQSLRTQGSREVELNIGFGGKLMSMTADEMEMPAEWEAQSHEGRVSRSARLANNVQSYCGFRTCCGTYCCC